MRRGRIGVALLVSSALCAFTAACGSNRSSNSKANASTTSAAPPRTTTTVCTAAQPVEIFFRLLATPAQIDAVRRRLAHDSTLTGVHFLDHADAYIEMQRLFRDDPDALIGVKPSELPESFRATIRAGTDPHTVTTRYATLAGVSTVNLPRSARQCGA